MAVSSFSSSISLPLVFKLGVEKGRIAYYVLIGVVCAGSVLASELFQGQLASEIHPDLLTASLAALGIGVYILSWCLSIALFKKEKYIKYVYGESI